MDSLFTRAPPPNHPCSNNEEDERGDGSRRGGQGRVHGMRMGGRHVFAWHGVACAGEMGCIRACLDCMCNVVGFVHMRVVSLAQWRWVSGYCMRAPVAPVYAVPSPATTEVQALLHLHASQCV